MVDNKSVDVLVICITAVAIAIIASATIEDVCRVHANPPSTQPSK